ncbi:uncharacterized protein LOC106171199 [Lingula anatina]|uniref:Uncharacterized protein LOC106171199 n=1 Tax=Lingula anatina TaxID=7574 RepID=A0A1S3J9H6_LINAN|nr:uncharacterized protein LOC106171199 [Lingula anatina]|eukprot:XP_013406871.1 uncharacterized protein LOC106171199 [Lingula anatina]
METDSYQYDANLAHHSDDEEVVDEVRGQFESNRVCFCEPPLPGSVKIQSMCESVEITRRTVSIFFKTSLGSPFKVEPFKVTSNVAFGVAEKGKEGVMIPVTTDVDPKSLPPPCDTMQCIHFQSHDFIPKLADVIKGPADAPLYGQLRNENENMKREIAALRQQLEDSTALNRRLQAEVMTADAPRQFVCEPNKLYRLAHSSMETDSYQCDVYLAHDSDDEEVVDEVRGKLEFSGVRCSEPALAGTSIIKSDNDPVKTAKRTVPFFSKNSLESKLFMMTCDVALIEANERKEDVMIPVTIDVDPKSLPPPYGTLNCIPYKSQDFIQKLIDAIKGPTDPPFYGQLRDENENLKRELAALRQQLEDSTSLNRRVQAELDAAAALMQFVCESEGT